MPLSLISGGGNSIICVRSFATGTQYTATSDKDFTYAVIILSVFVTRNDNPAYTLNGANTFVIAPSSKIWVTGYASNGTIFMNPLTISSTTNTVSLAANDSNFSGSIMFYE